MSHRLSSSKLKDMLFMLVDCLMDGGVTTTNGVTMTDATELYWGSSGRGNQGCKSRIRGASHAGLLRIVKTGRTERVFLTDSAIEFHNENSATNFSE
jgi:hypothetical protein